MSGGGPFFNVQLEWTSYVMMRLIWQQQVFFLCGHRHNSGALRALGSVAGNSRSCLVDFLSSWNLLVISYNSQRLFAKDLAIKTNMKVDGNSAGDLFEIVQRWPFQKVVGDLGMKRSLWVAWLQKQFTKCFSQQKHGHSGETVRGVRVRLKPSLRNWNPAFLPLKNLGPNKNPSQSVTAAAPVQACHRVKDVQACQRSWQRNGADQCQTDPSSYVELMPQRTRRIKAKAWNSSSLVSLGEKFLTRKGWNASKCLCNKS